MVLWNCMAILKFFQRFLSVFRQIYQFFNGSIFQTFFISPIEVVKVQQQIVAQDKPMSVKRTIGYIYENAGLRGFARGYGMCFFREPIAFTVYFSSFEWMTRFVFIRFSICNLLCATSKIFWTFQKPKGQQCGYICCWWYKVKPTSQDNEFRLYDSLH